VPFLVALVLGWVDCRTIPSASSNAFGVFYDLGLIIFLLSSTLTVLLASPSHVVGRCPTAFFGLCPMRSSCPNRGESVLVSSSTLPLALTTPRPSPPCDCVLPVLVFRCLYPLGLAGFSLMTRANWVSRYKTPPISAFCLSWRLVPDSLSRCSRSSRESHLTIFLALLLVSLGNGSLEGIQGVPLPLTLPVTRLVCPPLFKTLLGSGPALFL